jgi:penicillin amidase
VETAIAGLDGPVTILRDEWGIPHVRARTAHDAFFGQGFVQAQDRLGQLEHDRRRALGRWAEVAGAGAAPFDAFVRRCGLPHAARGEYAALSERGRAVLDAYAAGVNAFLALDQPLPTDLGLVGIVPDPWEPWHCNAVFLVRHVVFANWQKKLWRARVAGLLGAEAALRLETDDRAVPVIVPPGARSSPYRLDAHGFDAVAAAMSALRETDPESWPGAHEAPDPFPGGHETGSNSWVLSGRRTRSGRPLLAGDPHRAVEVPGVYVQQHLACDEFDAIGLSFVGVPGFPHFGHNAEVAWCVTNAYGDSQDLYVERFPADRTPDRIELVGVRGAEPFTVECYDTPDGPVVFGDPASGVAIAMQSTALVAPSTGLEVLSPMLGARTVEDLHAVMRAWVDPVNNLLCADRSGGILYQAVGTIPLRSTANACGPVPGWTGAHDWTGAVPYDAMPTVRDPQSGVIVTANQRIVGEDFPHHLSDGYARPDRAERILGLLERLPGATVDDMASIHRDVVSLRAPLWVARLSALSPAGALERSVLDLLRSWDGGMHADSAPAAVFAVVRDNVCRELARRAPLARLATPIRDEPPSAFVAPANRLWPVLSALLASDDRTLLTPGESWDDVLARALTDGVAWLCEELGGDPAQWRWGTLHVNVPTHPLSATLPEAAGRLDPPGAEMGGEWDTVLRSDHTVGRGFSVTTAAVARYVFDLDDWDASRWIVPLGAHGDAASTHFADQRSRWAAGELIPMRYSWSTLEQVATSLATLVPR